MDKFMSLGQLAMSIFMLLGVIAWGIAHTIKGTISFAGILVVLFIACLMCVFVRTAYAEYQQEKNK